MEYVKYLNKNINYINDKGGSKNFWIHILIKKKRGDQRKKTEPEREFTEKNTE